MISIEDRIASTIYSACCLCRCFYVYLYLCVWDLVYVMNTISKNNPLLSVIVPIHDTEKYLSICLDSIIAQTYKNHEIILIDNGSTDSSGTICDKYSSQYNNVSVIHQNDQGVILARLKGVAVAKGKYISFVDSDDWIDSDLCEKLMTPLLFDESIDISISPHIRNVDGTDRPQIQLHETAIRWSAHEACCYMMENKYFTWVMHGKIYKKKLFNNLTMINKQIPYGEDLEANWIIFQKATNVYYQPFFGYHYSYNINGMTNNIHSSKRLFLFERLRKISLDFALDDYKLRLALAKTICIKYSLWPVYAMEYCRLTDNDHRLKVAKELVAKSYLLAEKYLTPIDKRHCAYAQLTTNQFAKSLEQNHLCIIDVCRKLLNDYHHVFIYGAGVIATATGEILNNAGIDFEGYVTSDGRQKHLNDKSVCKFTDIFAKFGESAGFILALNESNTSEVEKFLQDFNVPCVNVGIYSFYY